MSDDRDLELGRLYGEVAGLRDEFRDFRGEQRRQMETLTTAITEGLRGHTERIGSLERWRASVKGGAKVGAAIVGSGGALAAAWQWLTSLFQSGPPRMPPHGGP